MIQPHNLVTHRFGTARSGHLLNQRVSKQNNARIAFDRYVWHASPSGKSVGWTAVLILLLLWFHTTEEHGQLQKTRCGKKILYHLFQAKPSSPESSTAPAYATFKDSATLDFSSHFVIISLPQSDTTATNFTLFYTAPLWNRARIERHFSSSSPQIWIIFLTFVLHKALCTIVLIAGEGKGLFKPVLQQGERAGRKKIIK